MRGICPHPCDECKRGNIQKVMSTIARKYPRHWNEMVQEFGRSAAQRQWRRDWKRSLAKRNILKKFLQKLMLKKTWEIIHFGFVSRIAAAELVSINVLTWLTQDCRRCLDLMFVWQKINFLIGFLIFYEEIWTYKHKILRLLHSCLKTLIGQQALWGLPSNFVVVGGHWTPLVSGSNLMGT